MTTAFFTSGDLVADRRAQYAEMLFESGDSVAAAGLMRETLDLVPDWPAGWYRLGEMLDGCGRHAEACDAWRKTLHIDPQDRLGATLKLALAGAVSGDVPPPPAFVELLFDQYASEFDGALIERLSYKVPDLLFQLLQQAGANQFAHVIDLGCGTGLMGERLRAGTSFLSGYDLSAGMLTRARAKGIYDSLAQNDITLLEPGANQADLVVAADVLMYVGAPERLFSWVAGTLAPGGLFAFSAESAVDEEGLVLRPSRRYAHSLSVLTRALEQAGMTIRLADRAVIREDRGEAVNGWIILAQPRTSGAGRTLPPVMAVDGAEQDGRKLS